LINLKGITRSKKINYYKSPNHLNCTPKVNKKYDVDYSEVKKYVKGLNLGRSNITDPASAGFSNYTKGLAMDINWHKFVS
jgi:hypothetical protein